MIDEVRLAITALRIKGVDPKAELAVMDIAGVHGAAVGLDGLRRPHLLLEVPASWQGVTPGNDVATLAVSTKTWAIGGRTVPVVDVACLFEAVAEVFEYFIVAVLERLASNPGSHVEALHAVLERWKQFLVPARSPVGRDRLAAVFGELLVLLDVVRADPAHRVDAWTGPHGGRHDFRRGDHAIEVKTTRSHSGSTATIHGADQLEVPSDGTLHLQIVRIEELPDAQRSVATVVDELLTVGVNAEGLFSALSAAGIPVADLAATGDRTYEVLERVTVPVDDDTPRIVRASFVDDGLPTGVLDLSYVVDLEQSLPRTLDARAYGAVVDRLAGA